MDPNNSDSDSESDRDSQGLDDEDLLDDEHGRQLNREEQQSIREGLVVKPVIVDFPSHHAGEVVGANGQSGYQDYQDSLGDGLDNVYAPFKSKVDWEFAKWAKLRGPGSMAASELFSIDGVSLSLTFLVPILG